MTEKQTVSRRGTSNGNDRGNMHDRRRRREWLVETYQADRPLIRLLYRGERSHDIRIVLGNISYFEPRVDDPNDSLVSAEEVPTCRCYRCGKRLTVDTVTVDRIVPGCLGGTYAHNNIRPACSECNSETGAAMANAKALRIGKMRARILKKRCDHCGAAPGQRCWGRNGKNLSIFHAPRRAAA